MLEPVTGTLRYIFFGVSGSVAFEAWLKFAFFIIVFAVLYNAGLKAFKGYKSMKRALVVITFLIALISAIFVPYDLLLYIFKLYEAILVVGFAILPALIGFLICRGLFNKDTTTDKILRSFIYAMIALFIMGLVGNIEARASPDTAIYQSILEPLLWGAILALVASLFNMLMALGGDGASGSLPGFLKGAPASPAAKSSPKGQTSKPAPKQKPNTPEKPKQPKPNNQTNPNTPTGPNQPSNPNSPQNPNDPKNTPHPPQQPPTPDPGNWPDPTNPKHNPTPPKDPHCPVEQEIRPVKPKPSEIKNKILIDLSPYFLPIKNQGKAGACAGFAAVAIIEFMLNVAGQKVDLQNELSDLYTYYLFRRNKQEDKGTYMHDIQRNGAKSPFERFWTWMPMGGDGKPTKLFVTPDEVADADANKKQVKDIRFVDPRDPDSWVGILQQKIPILIAMHVDVVFYKSKRIYLKEGGASLGYHAMTIVGYTNHYPDPRDTTKSVAAFKVRNSWGKGWGELGYIWIERDLLARNLCANPIIFIGLKGENSDPNGPLGETKEILQGIIALLANQKERLDAIKKLVHIEIKERDAIAKLIDNLDDMRTKEAWIQLLDRIEQEMRFERRIGSKEYKALKKLVRTQQEIDSAIVELARMHELLSAQQFPEDDPRFFIAQEVAKTKALLIRLTDDEKQKIQVLAEKVRFLIDVEGPEKELLDRVEEVRGIVRQHQGLLDEAFADRLEDAFERALQHVNDQEIAPTIQAIQALEQDRQLILQTLNHAIERLQGVVQRLQ